MALPNPNMSFSPFAILTAEEMNDLVENIEALADGSGLDDGAIKASNIDTGAITLGYAQRTSNFSNATTTQTLITGLEAAVTIPAGGRRIEVIVYIPNTHNTSISTVTCMIWDGAVVAGTKLQEWRELHAIAGNRLGISMMWSGTPAAGAKTYRASIAADAGTETVTTAATSPAFITVRAM